jgi:hypothetical protein
MTPAPDVSDYVSDRVFDGVRVLTPEQTAMHRARLTSLREVLAGVPDSEGESE